MIMTPRQRLACLICSTAMKHGASYGEVMGPSRHPRVNRARFACYGAVYESGRSKNLTARIMKRDHTTIIHGLRQLPELQERLPL